MFHMKKRSIKDAEFDGKTVLIRVDFNVPLRDGTISDDSRIRAAMPTLTLLKDGGTKIVICSHLARPKGNIIDDMRLTPVRERLSQLLGVEVKDAGGPNDPKTPQICSQLKSGELALLENMRFNPGEEANDPEFSKYLASLADIFVNDAFGAAHRAHASTAGVAAHLPAYAGLLMEQELEMLGSSLNSSKGATVAIVGGAKITDKIQVLRHLSEKVDTILVGGGMVAAFYIARGDSGGATTVSTEDAYAAERVLSSSGANVVLPADVVTAPEFTENSLATIHESTDVPANELILDIGPRSVTEYSRIISLVDTIIWNGPMGVFEWPAFSKGSVAVAKAVAANTKAVSVIGGGSTAEIVGSLDLVDKITHVSTGGGASLEFLEGKTLPGVAALDDSE